MVFAAAENPSRQDHDCDCVPSYLQIAALK
jgi:hypothetical protein